MAVTTIGSIESEVRRVRQPQKRPFGKVTMKEFNAVASFFGNQLFGNRKRLSRCGSTGVGVIDFADVEEETECTSGRRRISNGGQMGNLRSPRGLLQKMIPSNAAQLMQMDLILLDESPVLKDLQSCAWKGCCPRNRAQVWRLLSGYEPLKHSERGASLEAKRRLYKEYVSLLCAPEGTADLELALELKKYRSLERVEEVDISDVTKLQSTLSNTLKNANPDIVEYSDYSVKTLRQIEMDLPRTHPGIPIFHVPHVRDPMRRILYLYGMLNPNKDYVQGMNELLTPLLVVFMSSYLRETSDKGVEAFLNRKELSDALSKEELANAEADAFWTFTSVVSCIEDNFDADQRGILKRVARLEDIIRRVDPVLSKHLAQNGNDFIQFACRWMNCLLMRELPFSMVIKLWDALMAEEDGMADVHVYFCAAMITRFRAELLSKGFEDCIMFLQHLPTSEWKTEDIDVLLSQAYVWKNSLYLPSLAN